MAEKWFLQTCVYDNCYDRPHHHVPPTVKTLTQLRQDWADYRRQEMAIFNDHISFWTAQRKLPAGERDILLKMEPADDAEIGWRITKNQLKLQSITEMETHEVLKWAETAEVGDWIDKIYDYQWHRATTGVSNSYTTLVRIRDQEVQMETKKVWLVVLNAFAADGGHGHNHGNTILGVYSTKDKAQELFDTESIKCSTRATVSIVEVDLDQRIDVELAMDSN